MFDKDTCRVVVMSLQCKTIYGYKHIAKLFVPSLPGQAAKPAVESVGPYRCFAGVLWHLFLGRFVFPFVAGPRLTTLGVKNCFNLIRNLSLYVAYGALNHA